MTGLFLTIEGIEGAGKSTAVRFISDYLLARQREILLTREPGGTPLAEEIRNIILFPQANEVMLPETELLLMFAARVQHIQQCILPGLHAGKCVISDRFVDASYAYQAGGRGLPLAMLASLNKHFIGDLKPDLTFLLDIAPEIGLERAKSRGQGKDRIESEKIDFFKRVRKVYLERAALEPNRIHIIDASLPQEAVVTAIYTILDDWMAKLSHGN